MHKSIASSYCPECGPLAISHRQKWIDDLLVSIPFHIQIPIFLDRFTGYLIDRVLVALKVLWVAKDFSDQRLPARSKVFIDAAISRGWKVEALCSRSGFINQYYLIKDGKRYHFEGLPRAEHRQGRYASRMDEKQFVKKVLKRAGMPICPGRDFWFFQKEAALRYARENLGYPVVVKPLFSSLGHHVMLNIKNEDELIAAISSIKGYTPRFIIERYLPYPHVYRYNVIGKKDVFVARRTPPYVVGDGLQTIQRLVDLKNSEPERGPAGHQGYSRYKLLIDKRAHAVLAAQGYGVTSVPEKGQLVYVQDKVLLDLGAEIAEETPTVHPENKELARRVSQLFGANLVGIDILMNDSTVSWKEQDIAIVELNSLPYIDIHQFPEKGQPQDAGEALSAMVEENYR